MGITHAKHTPVMQQSSRSETREVRRREPIGSILELKSVEDDNIDDASEIEIQSRD